MAPGAFDADTVARCRDLLRTVPVRRGPEGTEPGVADAGQELWTWPAAGAAAPEALEARDDPEGEGLFLSHAWDEPEGWGRRFPAQPYAAAKLLQADTGLQAALGRGLAKRPRVWLDRASMRPPAVGGEPAILQDHPLAQVSFGPYQLPVQALKDESFLPRSQAGRGGYTLLHLPQGFEYKGSMELRSFDALGRAEKQAESKAVAWALPPGSYYVRSAKVLPEGSVSPQQAAAKEAFAPRQEQLRGWCARLELRDSVWVELTLGSARAECLLLWEPMLAMQAGLVALASWNYFDRLWPLCEWALFCAHRGPERIQLAADAFLRPALVEYRDALRRLSVSKAGCREALDRKLLLETLERVFRCDAKVATLHYERPDLSQPAQKRLAQTKAVRERQVDYGCVERYVKATAVAVFAREAALTASRRLHADDEEGWIALAGELGLKELHAALKRCKPFDWEHEAASAADPEDAYTAAALGWWQGTVLPVLERERRAAVR